MNLIILFITIGTGFSYVDHNKYLTKNNNQIAKDLLQLLKGFYAALPEFISVPLHIFGEVNIFVFILFDNAY